MTKYYNYTVNETDEEREHRLPTLPKATRLDQATLNVYSQNSIPCDFVKILRCSDRQQDFHPSHFTGLPPPPLSSFARFCDTHTSSYCI